MTKFYIKVFSNTFFKSENNAYILHEYYKSGKKKIDYILFTEYCKRITQLYYTNKKYKYAYRGENNLYNSGKLCGFGGCQYSIAKSLSNDYKLLVRHILTSY